MNGKQPRKPSGQHAIKVHEMAPDRWKDLEHLMGSRGGVGGCWCQYWHLEKGEQWNDVKGPVAHGRLKAQIAEGRIGLLAYENDVPVGWVSIGPRRDFPRLDRAPSHRCDDADQVWSVSCFYVTARRRSHGVATALLRGAVELARKAGAPILEGYPFVVRSGKAPGAFVWTGVVRLFRSQGFAAVEDKDHGRVRMRLRLRAAKS